MLNVFYVVTLYGRSLQESIACRTLAELSVPSGLRLSGLVFDNTPNRVSDTTHPRPGLTYIAAGGNLGLPAAYNRAMHEARSIGCDFLLLIDQDSSVSQEYLDGIEKALARATADQVAWVPRVYCGKTLISPYRMSAAGCPRFGFARPNARMFAINSFSVIALGFLSKIGGFDEYYWLDALDTWFYSQVAAAGAAVGMIDVSVQHELSLLAGNVPAWRMINIARYEACLVWERLSPLQAVVGTLRLVARGALKSKQLIARGCLLAYFGAIARGVRSGIARR